MSENLTRIVHLRIRHFPSHNNGASRALALPSEAAVPVPVVISEEQWQRAVDLVYERLLTHLKAQAKARAIEDEQWKVTKRRTFAKNAIFTVCQNKREQERE